MTQQNPQQETAESFNMKCAALLLKAAQTETLAATRAGTLLRGYLGIDVRDAQVTEQDFVLPDIKAPAMVDGKPRSAYTAEFLRKHDHDRLQEARFTAYTYIRREMNNGYILPAKAEELAREMGLPVPTASTGVTVRPIGAQPFTFCLPGEHDSEEDLARYAASFDSLVIDPMGDIVRRDYPEAADTLPLRVRVTASVTRTWPEFKADELSAEPETSSEN